MQYGKLAGYITMVESDCVHLVVPYNRTDLIDKMGITEAFVTFHDPRMHSPAQHGKVFGLIGEIARWSAGRKDYKDAEDIRSELTYSFCIENGIKPFSMSDADMTTVRRFIDYIVAFCVYHDVPCQDNSLLEYCEDISKYVYACLATRKCVITGKKAQIHHVDAIGMGYNREEKPNIGARAIPLHWKMHREIHDIGNQAFFEKYHVYGIKLDSYLCEKLNLKK